jgi:FkbM family methyltransferase
MTSQFIKRFVWRFRTCLEGDVDVFLKKAKGIIHVGANLGQECEIYAKHELNVLWIEPIPEVYAQLKERVSPFSKQKALCHLVADTDEKQYVFHISNNGGVSSSIFDIADHKKLWPDVSFNRNISIKSIKLSTLVQREKIDLTAYDALAMDTQGSEMLVMKGAIDILSHFRFIKLEVADFESYKGCCRLPDIDQFLRCHGFRRMVKHRFAHKRGIGSYFDVLYTAHK